MTKNDINIKINVDGKSAVSSVDETTEAIKKLGKTTDKLERNITNATSSAKKTTMAAKDLSKSADDVTSSVDKSANTVKNLNKQIKNSTKESEAAEKSWGKFVYTLNQSFQLLERTTGYAKSALDSLKDGANYTEAKESFDAYAKSLGANSDAIISSLRKASAETISNRNLVLTASRAMALGVTSDSEKMGKLLEIARNRATLFGVDTTKAFDDIVTGIGRGSPIILDNLGIRIPAGFAQMTQGMTEAQKVSKLLELVLADGGRELESLKAWVA